ncbi:hypothetical protein ACVIYH_001130 [Bradyrhizobium diazoefficiens]
MSTPAGIHCFSSGDQRLHAVDGVDDVGIALLGDLDQHRRLLVEPGDRAGVADGVLDFGDVGKPDEIAVGALDDDVAELFRGAHLLVQRQRLALALAVEDADGTKRIGVDDCDPHVVGGDAGVRQRDGVQLHPHGRLVGAADRDVADTRHLRDALRQHRIGNVVDRARRQCLRGQCQHEDGRAGRVRFPEARQGRQIARQVHQRGVDRGLHVARGLVDVAADVELELDVGDAERRRRGDLVDARYLT